MEKKIESVLNSLDHVHRAGPGPYFFTRVQARLNVKDRTIWEKISAFIAQPVVAFSVICLIISLNTLVIFKGESGSADKEQNSVYLSEDSDIDTIAFYEEENNNTDPQ